MYLTLQKLLGLRAQPHTFLSIFIFLQFAAFTCLVEPSNQIIQRGIAWVCAWRHLAIIRSALRPLPPPERCANHGKSEQPAA